MLRGNGRGSCRAIRTGVEDWIRLLPSWRRTCRPTLPGDIPEHIEIDVSDLALNEGVRLRDVVKDVKWTPVSDLDTLLAHVVPLRAAPEEAAPAAEAAATATATVPAEPEVIKKGKTEKEEEKEKDKPLEPSAGLNRFLWDLRILKPWFVPKAVFNEGEKAPPRVAPGTYEIRLTARGRTLTRSAEVRPRPNGVGPSEVASTLARMSCTTVVRPLASRGGSSRMSASARPSATSASSHRFANRSTVA